MIMVVNILFWVKCCNLKAQPSSGHKTLFKAVENGSVGTNAATAHAPVPPQLLLPATGFQ